jgi:hypothetical protein
MHGIAEIVRQNAKSSAKITAGAAGYQLHGLRCWYEHREAPDTVILSVDHSTVPEGDRGTEYDFVASGIGKPKSSCFIGTYLLPAGITGLVGLVGCQPLQ